ncbi:2'-5' RNA ligase family protein [Terrilactibacillus sp. S3-3]|nr:2'-5' RNA ligase family protein [Terrilactibacillus sp. S3-3]
MTESHYFIAVPIPPNIRSVLASWASGLRRELKFRYWTSEEDYHITLFFMGASTQEQAVDVKRGLQEMIRREQEFFSRSERHRWIWAKRMPESGVCRSIFKRGAHGFEKKKGGSSCSCCRLSAGKKPPYHPHITLAKKWSGGFLEAPAHYTGDVKGLLRWRVDQIVLFKVAPHLTPRYVPVKTLLILV